MIEGRIVESGNEDIVKRIEEKGYSDFILNEGNLNNGTI